MSKEKQIEIKVVTYKEERLNYFTALYEKAKNKFDRLFKKHKDAPYLSDEFQKLSDAGHEAEFLGDVVKMLKQSEWISVDERLPEKYGDVLCHTRKGAIWQVTYNPKYRLFNVSYDNVENAMDVDYWMPLPEPPKMKGGAE